MKSSIVKRIIAAGVCVVMTIGLAACGKSGGGSVNEIVNSMSKKQLKDAYVELYGKYVELCERYDSLNIVVSGIQNEEAPSAAIDITGDGTGRFTFNSTDSKIIFPSSFKYPNSEQIAPNGRISIVNDVTVETSSTWIYKLTGSALELEHSSGISGTIKVSQIGTNFSTEALQTGALEPWFSELPPSSVSYTNIFIGNNSYGVQAKTKTLIDSEDAYLTCGMVGFGKYAITYVFVYRGDQDTSKDESIYNVINSIEISKNRLLVGDK